MNSATARRLSRTALGILFVAIMLFPVYWMLNTALQSGSAATNATILPIHPDFSSFAIAIHDQLGNLVTTLIIALGTVAFTLLIATPAAYALAKFKLPWLNAVLLALVITQMIPGVVIANAIYPIYNSLGLLDSIPGLIFSDASTSVPFAILILRAFMMSIPASLIEAARVDGASQFRAFRSIAVPLSRNAIITAGLFSFLFGWSDFLFALTLTTGQSIRPITLGIYNYLNANVQSWGPVMATAVLASIPAIVLLIFAQRFIAAGALGGALK